MTTLPMSRSHCSPFYHTLHRILRTVPFLRIPLPAPLLLSSRLLLQPPHSLLLAKDRRPFIDARAPRRHYLRDYVFDVPTYLALSGDSDDVTGAEGGVWVGDEVALVGLEML